MEFKTKAIAAAVAATASIGGTNAAWADGGAVAAGLLGGMVVSRAMQNNRQAAYDQGYSQAQRSQPTVVYQQAPPAQQSSTKSTEQRIQELDDLAAKGYISKSEYEARKKAIIDNI